jgi:CO/xanthine dehydrogenase Mo-binding subunit
MSAIVEDALILEPERYELLSGPSYHFELARRDFFRVLGGGLLVVFALASGGDNGTALAQESGGGGRRGGQALPVDIGSWVHIGEDGIITAYTGKVEVGQNIRTSLAQVIAEELRVPLTSVRMVMADTELTPYDAGTFGSRTTPIMSPQLRKAAAAAREALLDLAAEKLQLNRNELQVMDGKVVHLISSPNPLKAVRFGELTRGEKLMKAIGDSTPTTPPQQWKVAGKPAPKVNGRDIVTGAHHYTSDMKRPGMLYGRVLRPEAFGATLVSADTKAAERLLGVTIVRDGDFIGVVAPSVLKAERARDAIKAKWNAKPQPSAKELFPLLKKGTSNRPAEPPAALTETLAAAKNKVERSYNVAYIAHAPLEPRAAVAEWTGDKLTVWTGTQRPFGVRGELAQAFQLPEEKVRVIVPDTGSGYGGKHTGEVAVEAARLAKAAGKPVKLVWTREEEFTWAYFRPAGVIDIKSAVTDEGMITAWEFHNYNSGGAAIRALYDIPNQYSVFHPADSPLRQGSYRALAATANHFAREVQMDEMAQLVKMDPLAFRLKNIKDERLRAVLEAAAKTFGWDKVKSTSERGFGIACGSDKGGYIANCAEIAIDPRKRTVKLVRVVTVFECGAIINPNGLKNQIEGGIVQGIGGALFEAIEFENGKILNPFFSQYRLPRFSDVPVLETVLLDRKDLPSAGAGESPLVTLAPAIGNAIYAATGVRIRSLPMVPQGLPR